MPCQEPLQSRGHFKVEGAELYHITKIGTVRKATGSDEVDEIIRRMHCDMGGSHCGQDKAIRKISERWLLVRDV